MAPANSLRALRHPYLLGWLICALLSFLQSPGLTAADTKHDLAADPGHFLRGALTAWTDIFPLGQLQNQAYGYLFPQGLFFLLTDPLPDWIAQRLWWTIVLGVGFSGFLALATRLNIGDPAWRFLGAFLFALSPRTITTLGAISSETWPIMLAPWAVLPLIGTKPRLCDSAASVLAIAAIGAVNATATAAACIPAFVALILARAWVPLLAWLGGVAAVSLWWLGPLFVLGRYAPPFTDFIESSYVTTRWLNLVELLRGTSSWAPFADSEREAGTLLATSSYFVLITAAVAVIGLSGLVTIPQRRLWVSMLLIGALIMSSAHGPFGTYVLEFLDGPGAPLRNVHKFDALVHLPIVLGFVHASASMQFRDQGRRYAAAALVCVVALATMAPAWSGRLAPRGAYEQVPQYWQDAADWLNTNAEGTRTVILPQTSFARQEWGWTRDEPLQPLLDVPWVVRDAVPLVPPEAIRGLDGLMAHPTPAGFARLGVGAAVIRHDLIGGADSKGLTEQFRTAGFKVHEFGDVDIVEFDLDLSMQLSSGGPVRVAGGGESLALLDDLNGPATYQLVDADAQIVTDTPQLTTRNYGGLHNAQSAPLARPEEGEDVRNAVPDYPSAGPLSRIREGEVRVSASSSAASATSFGGADPTRSVTAAVDGSPDTAWYPAPGSQRGQWMRLHGQFTDPVVRVKAEGAPVVVTFTAGDSTVNRVARPGSAIEVQLPVQAEEITITLGSSPEPAGIAEVSVAGHDVSRILEVPDTSPNAQQFVFQRVFLDTGRIHRSFTAPRDMQVRIAASSCDEEPKTANSTGITDDFLLDGTPISCGQLVDLPAGQHELSTTASWITLTTPEFTTPTPPVSSTGHIDAQGTDRILVTGRAFNPGLNAQIAGTELEALQVDAATQGFIVPAGIEGPVELRFAGQRPYQWSLLGGLILALLTVAGCTLLVLRSRTKPRELVRDQDAAPTALGVLSLIVLAGWPGLAAGLTVALIVRYTLITRRMLAGLGMAIAGLWLAHAPWPNELYAGDQWFVTFACCLSLAALALPTRLTARSTGASTK